MTNQTQYTQYKTKEAVVSDIKAIGQIIIDKAEEIAVEPQVAKSITITGRLVAGELASVRWAVEKYVADLYKEGADDGD